MPLSKCTVSYHDLERGVLFVVSRSLSLRGLQPCKSCRCFSRLHAKVGAADFCEVPEQSIKEVQNRLRVSGPALHPQK